MKTSILAILAVMLMAGSAFAQADGGQPYGVPASNGRTLATSPNSDIRFAPGTTTTDFGGTAQDSIQAP